MTGNGLARLALALSVVAGAACGVVGSKDRLSDAQEVIAGMKLAPSDAKGAEQKPGELTIRATADHADRRYSIGEPIALSVEVGQAAHVAVLRVMPNGATTLVFPNRRQPDARVSANAPLRAVIAADRSGVALFEFIASTRGDSWLFNRKPEPPADFAELGTTTRELARDIRASLKIGHGPQTAAAHLTVRVEGE